jgi:hypothetical protein
MPHQGFRAMRRCLAFIVSIVACAARAYCDSTDFTSYVNARFKYAILYPKDVLYPQGESDNGDGERFISKHADIKLIVFGQYNTSHETISDLYHSAARGGLPSDPKRVVIYRVLKQRWFVVSGYNGQEVFYEKTILNGDVVDSMTLTYPTANKHRFDRIAARIGNSFHTLSTSLQ